MRGLSTFEQAVLDALLAGDQHALVTLRAQAARGQLVSREHSGVGFFCEFAVPADAPKLVAPGRFTIDDVTAEISGLAHGAGFVLFVREGILEMLEGFSYDEPWPEEISGFKLTYLREPRVLSLPDSSASAT